VLGTPSYVAPEQAFGGAREAGPAADIYALGAILYELLTGRPPFKAPTLLETLEQVHTQEPAPPSRLQLGLPKDIQTICLKCLDKDPRRRYASAAELADDLGHFLRNEPIRARPVGMTERLWKWAKRKPTAAALVGVSVVATGAILAVTLWHNAKLRAEVVRADANASLAEDNRKEADANYVQARNAIQRILARSEDPRWSANPRLLELRRDQLDDAMRFYEGVIAKGFGDDTGRRLDSANAHREAAKLQIALGRNDSAEAGLRSSIDLLEPLVAEYPQEPEYALALIRSRNQLGALFLANRGDLEQARAQYQRALDLCRELPTQFTTSEGMSAAQAESHLRLGQVLDRLRRMPEAESQHRLAAPLLEKVCQTKSPNPEHLKMLAQVCQHIAFSYDEQHRSEAKAELEKAKKILKELVRDHPDDVASALELSRFYITVVNLEQPGSIAERLANLLEARRIAKGILEREPGMVDAKRQVFRSHGNAGMSLAAVQRYAEALREYDEALKWATNDLEKDMCRGQRAVSLAWLGRHAEAVAEARELAGRPQITASEFYVLAIVFARASEKVRGDPQLTSAERASRSTAYVGESMHLLRRIKDTGILENPDFAKQLRETETLAPLHGRPEFQKFLQEMKK
jgi:tetratricopeptide (TPR) repeat protein